MTGFTILAWFAIFTRMTIIGVTFAIVSWVTITALFILATALLSATFFADGVTQADAGFALFFAAFVAVTSFVIVRMSTVVALHITGAAVLAVFSGG